MQRIILYVELADGGTFDALTINNRAMVDYDFERAAKKWPPATEAPILWLTFLAYRQLIHAGIVNPDVTFKAFREDLCTFVDKLKDLEDDADPSQPVAAPDSVSQSAPLPA
jgi:hypothetical protein